LGYLWDISGVGQGFYQVLDITGMSFEVFGISQIQQTWNRISQINERYPKIRKPGMGYPKTNEL
jgi:hypothetical protein